MLVKRNMDEMITHFNDVVSAMDISIKDKMTILGMITAIGYEYQEAADAIEELSRIERDFQQYISDQVKREKGVYACCYCKNRKSANKYEPGCIHEECDGVSGWQYGTPKEET